MAKQASSYLASAVARARIFNMDIHCEEFKTVYDLHCNVITVSSIKGCEIYSNSSKSTQLIFDLHAMELQIECYCLENLNVKILIFPKQYCF